MDKFGFEMESSAGVILSEAKDLFVPSFAG